MGAAHRVRGTGASAGVALGQVHLAGDAREPFPPRADASVERDSLVAAIRIASDALQALCDRADPDSAAILDFQIEILSDPMLTEMVFERMQDGQGVAFAWAKALDSYILDLEASDDEAVSARAVDLIDIKNRVLSALKGEPIRDFPPGSVFVGKDLEPSRFLAHDWSQGGGIALYGGSVASHVAMLARAKAVPMVVAAGRFAAADADPILIDGSTGEILVRPDGADAQAALRRRGPAFAGVGLRADSGALTTSDGVPARLFVNLNDPAEIVAIDPATIAGVGLMRSEFSIATLADAANEEMQFDIYRRLLEWAGGRPVTIRMLDLGGDKRLDVRAADPDFFQGLRGIRLLLARPDMARPQARALLRAAVHGNLNIMLPMVTRPADVTDMAAILEDEARQLVGRSIPHRMPPLGMMVEVPAAALMLDRFGAADFFSFGTNDLGQYLTAAARDAAEVSGYYEEAPPAVLRLLAHAMRLAAATGKPTAICGDIASDPRYIPALLAAGLRHFSVAPGRLSAVRSAIAAARIDGMQAAGD